MQRLQASFVDASKDEYLSIDVGRERHLPLSLPGCHLEYADIDLERWLLDGVIELGLWDETPTTIFGEVELAQLMIAFGGPETDPKYNQTIRLFLDSHTEYMDYLSRLSFIYNTHENPFKRLEVLVVSLLTSGQILCYSTSTVLSRHTPEERS